MMSYQNIFLLGLLLLMASCNKNIMNEEPQGNQSAKYDPDVQTIMFNRCITCHGGTLPSGGFALTSYEEVRWAAENLHLLGRINDSVNPMPPSGLMSEKERAVIEQWATEGYPRN